MQEENNLSQDLQTSNSVEATSNPNYSKNNQNNLVSDTEQNIGSDNLPPETQNVQEKNHIKPRKTKTFLFRKNRHNPKEQQNNSSVENENTDKPSSHKTNQKNIVKKSKNSNHTKPQNKNQYFNFVPKNLNFEETEEIDTLSPEEKTLKEAKWNVFNYLRHKSGKNTNIFAQALFNVKELGIDPSHLKNSSGTNLLGMCILYDEPFAWQYLTSNYKNIDCPEIFNLALLNTAFNKSPEINALLIDFYSFKGKSDILSQDFLMHAPTAMFRQENIALYLQKFSFGDKEDLFEDFVKKCFLQNNRPILYELSQDKKYYKFLKNNLHFACDPATEKWMSNLLSIKESIKKTNKIHNLSVNEINTQNSNSIEEIQQSQAHLSDAEDNMKLLSGENETQITKKKRSKINIS